MNLSLSKGGLPASVKNRAWQYCQMAWRGVTSKKALSRLAVLSPLLLPGVGQMASATDLLAGGKDDVKATFGADSFVMMCIIIAELIVGVAMYIRTKNLLILLGLVVVGHSVPGGTGHWLLGADGADGRDPVPVLHGGAVNGGSCSAWYRSGTAMWLSRPHRKNHCCSGAGRPFPSGVETSAA